MLVEYVGMFELLWRKISVLIMRGKLNFGVTIWPMISVFWCRRELKNDDKIGPDRH